jgi:ABC-type glucose/galactose transport system permease subunit
MAPFAATQAASMLTYGFNTFYDGFVAAQQEPSFD